MRTMPPSQIQCYLTLDLRVIDHMPHGARSIQLYCPCSPMSFTRNLISETLLGMDGGHLEVFNLGEVLGCLWKCVVKFWVVTLTGAGVLLGLSVGREGNGEAKGPTMSKTDPYNH